MPSQIHHKKKIRLQGHLDNLIPEGPLRTDLVIFLAENGIKIFTKQAEMSCSSRDVRGWSTSPTLAIVEQNKKRIVENE